MNLHDRDLLFVAFHSVDWSEAGTIDPEQEVGEQYLRKFRNQITEKLRNSIESSLAVDPDGGKGRKKTVQVSVSHIWFYLSQLLIINEVGKLSYAAFHSTRLMWHVH
jgi:hypothetical protein